MASRSGFASAWFFGAFLASCGAGTPSPEDPSQSESPSSQSEAADGSERNESSSSDPSDDPSDPQDVAATGSRGAPFEPKALEGPFTRLAEYLETHAVPPEESCDSRSRPASRPQRIGASGPILEGQLVRLPGTIACAPVEYCVLAIRTKEGWFAAKSDAPCGGVVGPGSERSTSQVKTRFAGAERNVILAVEETRRTSTVEYQEVGGAREEREQSRESRYVTLCGVGASGRPSCAPPAVLSCPNAQGGTSEATWSWVGEQVTFESEADPQDACEWDAPFMVGTFEVRFP